ncbi:MAG TPA: rod shape-determining protein MreC [Gammaproteobacteria bacterium]|nr:rod shape-determining protein MreC [Gammaproteobacteria bacterium]
MKPPITHGQMKPLFIHGPSVNLRLFFFVILSIVLMAIDHRLHQLEALRATLATAVYPVQYLATIPASLDKWLTESLSSRKNLTNDRVRLAEENLLLKGQLQKFAALETENMRLRELLQSSQKLKTRMLIAELLAVDMDPFRHKITLNKGARYGVVEGQPLLDSTGIVGQIVHVSPLTSTALLITDPSHALPVQINRNGLRAIAIGTGSFNRLDVPYLSKNADVQVGDLLITSGLGGRFPPDYPVAKIISVERDPGQPFAKVSAEPSARLERSREVLLIWPEKNKLPDAPVAADAPVATTESPADAQAETGLDPGGIGFTPVAPAPPLKRTPS